MLNVISNISKTAASFLQTGTAPPGTPEDQREQLEKTNHLSSKKFFVALTGFLILGVFYASSVAVLFALNKYPALVASYSVIFTKTVEVFAAIMAVYLGGQAVVDLKYNSSSNASLEGKIEQVDITNRTIGNEKEDDYVLEDHSDEAK
jgi:hypothetical protein